MLVAWILLGISYTVLGVAMPQLHYEGWNVGEIAVQNEGGLIAYLGDMFEARSGSRSRAHFTMYDDQGRPRIILEIGSNGSPSMEILDEKGAPAWRAP